MEETDVMTPAVSSASASIASGSVAFAGAASVAVSMRDVSKSFNGLHVVHGFSLEVKRGSIVAIVGPSGVGKTTILKLAAGVLTPDVGSVDIRAEHVGYVFQEPRLLPWRTARENIALVLRAAGEDKAFACKKAQEWLERLRLDGFGDYYPAQLSGGMMQRVSLGRAFAAEPEIVLMDEPFSSIDIKLKTELLGMIAGIIKDQGATVLYVTHDLSEALRLADRIVEMGPDRSFRELLLENRAELLGEWVAALMEGREWV